MAEKSLSKIHARIRYEVHPNDQREAIVMLMKSKYGLDIDPSHVTTFDYVVIGP